LRWPTSWCVPPRSVKDGIDPEGDYEVDEKQRNATLTDEGYAKAEQLLGVSDLFDPADPWAHYITNALKAKELFISGRSTTSCAMAMR
jgi:preprotein translocase subunit SecA